MSLGCGRTLGISTPHSRRLRLVVHLRGLPHQKPCRRMAEVGGPPGRVLVSQTAMGDSGPSSRVTEACSTTPILAESRDTRSGTGGTVKENRPYRWRRRAGTWVKAGRGGRRLPSVWGGTPRLGRGPQRRGPGQGLFFYFHEARPAKPFPPGAPRPSRMMARRRPRPSVASLPSGGGGPPTRVALLSNEPVRGRRKAGTGGYGRRGVPGRAGLFFWVCFCWKSRRGRGTPPLSG